MKSRRITVIVVLWNSVKLLPELARTLEALSGMCRAVLVDNGSTDGTVDEVRKLIPGADIIEAGRNGGFGYGNNLALKKVASPFVLFLNNDARIDPYSLGILLESLERDVDTAGVQPVLKVWKWPLLCAGEGTSITRFGEGYDLRYLHFDPGQSSKECTRVPGVTAAVSLWRTSALEEVSGFDESIFMYFEDVDLCMRLATGGWKFKTIHEASALHRTGASSVRRKARIWELSSSVFLARRYFGSSSGRLPRYWRRRELRTRAGCIMKGIPWTWRIGAVRRGLALPTKRIELTGEMISLIRSRPMDMPKPRPGDSINLDPEGIVRTGPGFSRTESGHLISGYGCLEVRNPGMVTAGLSTPGHSRSGGLWSEEGSLLCRFNTSPQGVLDIRATVASGEGKIYVTLDEQDATALISEVSYEE